MISLKNLHEASLQDIFNQVASHMLRQGVRAAIQVGERK